ncbi:MAG: AIPR family protein [Bacteroidia bacterium]|nr:AIPR family protein [Bacteroidia bacterium]
MEISELIKYRSELIEEASSENSVLSPESFLLLAMSFLNESKLTDSEECHLSYFLQEKEQVKIHGHLFNESEERLQLFLINEEGLFADSNPESFIVSQKAYYEKQFGFQLRFAKKMLKGYLDDYIQDSSPVKGLFSTMRSATGMRQVDVIELFVISPTITVEKRGQEPYPKKIEFEDENITINYTWERSKTQKEILIIKRLIDLNFFYNVLISQGRREALSIDFEGQLNSPIEYLRAADEDNFESYLCVLPATVLAELYKRYSSRLLEKNVRSFLQFRNAANSGMLQTLKKEPEKFIAFNNGLTITATEIKLSTINGKNIIRSLMDFQIVNGGQTTASIYFARKDGVDVSKVNVMAKINVVKDVEEEDLDDLIRKVSIYSNTQSKVSKVDLNSRTPQLVKFKSLSESILTPSQSKWFFERARGEFNTLVRKSSRSAARIKKEYPAERKLTKEQLGKYYTAWGSQPYMVKKGGEKVFRYFLELITGDGDKKKAIVIDRDFYEDAIARVILFRSMEKIYGRGSNAMGQIRSAVIPYSLSALHKFTDGARGGEELNMNKIWKEERIGDELTEFLRELMVLMNDLIKQYSKSDDLGEFSKKKELWDDISSSSELRNFFGSKDFEKIKTAWCQKKVKKKTKKAKEEIDFMLLVRNAEIYANTLPYYSRLTGHLDGSLSKLEKYRLGEIISALRENATIKQEYIDFEEGLIHKVRTSNPAIFDQINVERDETWIGAVDFILAQYNQAIETGVSIEEKFRIIKQVAMAKETEYISSFDVIWKDLARGELPEIGQIGYVREFCAKHKSVRF